MSDWILALKNERNYIKAIDIVYEVIGDLQTNEDFDKIDEILLSPSIQEIDIYFQVAFIHITDPYKDKYKNRDRLFPLVEEGLLKTMSPVAVNHILDKYR